MATSATEPDPIRLDAAVIEGGETGRDASSALLVQLDRDRRVVRCSPSVEATLGRTLEPLRSERAMGPDAAFAVCVHDETMDGPHGPRRVAWVDLPLLDGGALCVGRDVTDQEEALHDRDATIRAILTTAADGILTIDTSGRVDTFNCAATRMFGYDAPEVEHRSIRQLIPDPGGSAGEDYVEWLVRRGREAPGGPDVVGVRKDGSTFPVEFAVGELHDGLLRYTIIIRDRTGRQLLEEELRHAQKMEAVGRLASGIAHDFNNLLMGIIGCADIATEPLSEGHPSRRSLEALRQAALDGAAIARQLLGLGRREDDAPEDVQLDGLLARNRGLLRRLIGDDVRLELDLDAAGATVRTAPGQLDQVLLNLVVNARDAMPDGGRLTLRTRRSTGLEPMAPGAYVRLEVQDDGVGMDPAVRARAFEPFFTTKPEGQGSGLGLSTVYGIMRRAGGHIEIDTTRGEGTTVRLWFPVVRATVPPVLEAPPPRVHDRRPRRVLVVDDEGLVRLAVRHYLEGAGHSVFEAAHADAAIEIARGCVEVGERIDVLLTDMILPGASGSELAGELVGTFPDLCVLYMSAHPREVLLEQGRLSPDARSLSKPFSAEELLEAVDVSAAECARPAAARARPTLLLVEAEELSRSALAELLEQEGHRVLVVPDAAAATACFAEHEHEIDLLVTDVELRDRPGPELVAQLRRARPDLGVVYISEYDLSGSEPPLGRATQSVAKPVDLERILAAIRGLLGRPCR